MKTKIYLPVLFILVLSGFQVAAQPALPVVTVRFANPVYDCPTQTYCLDVEFISDTPGQKLFGMNVRFFYDGNILEYLSIGDFQDGYNVLEPPVVEQQAPGSGSFFGLSGPLEWFNGQVQVFGPATISLSTTTWTKLFHICFRVKDPVALEGVDNFCPPIIWDLQEDFLSGGYLQGDDGVVMTVVDQTGQQDSSPTTENVVQFNWEYNFNGNSVGQPVSTICVSTNCGHKIPLSNWSLFLGIGLMTVVTLFIYRRRISG